MNAQHDERQHDERTSGLHNLIRHNAYTASAGLPTAEQIDAASRRARVERARAAASLSMAAWRRLRAAAGALMRALARAEQQRRAHRELRHLDPHLREDIGIGRDYRGDLLDTVPRAPEPRREQHRVDPATARCARGTSSGEPGSAHTPGDTQRLAA